MVEIQVLEQLYFSGKNIQGDKMRGNKDIIIKLVILIVAILLLIGLGTFLNRNNFLHKTENVADTEVAKNIKEEVYLEGYITINQEDYETTKAAQTLTGKNLMGKEISQMWYKHESTNGVSEFEIITYTNEDQEVENFKLIPGENEITIFAQIDNDKYKSNVIKIYYDSGEGYQINAEDIKFDNKEQRYYNNVVIIDFEEEVSELRRNEIVESIEGKVVGRINILDQFQVEVSPRELSKMEQIDMNLKNNK